MFKQNPKLLPIVIFLLFFEQVPFLIFIFDCFQMLFLLRDKTFHITMLIVELVWIVEDISRQKLKALVCFSQNRGVFVLYKFVIVFFSCTFFHFFFGQINNRFFFFFLLTNSLLQIRPSLICLRYLSCSTILPCSTFPI